MANIAADKLPLGRLDPEHLFLSAVAPGWAQKRAALVVTLVLVAAFFMASGPLASLRLPAIEAFVPAYAVGMFLNDAVTAALLFGQFLILRSRALMVIACGYLFAALMIIPWMLTFPGVLPADLLGAGLQSPTSFYILRHIGFPLLVIVYALLKDDTGQSTSWSSNPGAETFVSVIAVFAFVAATAWIVIAEDARLPQFMVDATHPSEHLSAYLISTGVLSIIALVVLWIRRYSVLDLWLAVVLFAYVIEILLISFPVPARFTMGWYVGRIFGWIASGVVLITFLYEITALYARAIQAVVAQRRIEQDLLAARDHLQIEVDQRRHREQQVNQLNAELRQRASELEFANKELESFAYSVSHDLRAPLRHVVGFAELLQKYSASHLDEKSQRYARTIQDSARHMGTLIDDLLSFSRVGRTETRKTVVSLDQLLRDAISEFAQETSRRDIAWKIAALPPCYGDRSMLKLALQNLIANALKFTRTRARAEIEIGTIDGNPNEVVVFVRDNGVGFDMRHADKLFGVFQRLHRVEEFEGTGIGLATVQRIIQRHGGEVRAEGAPDRGATFYFSLPRHEDRGPACLPAAATLASERAMPSSNRA